MRSPALIPVQGLSLLLSAYIEFYHSDAQVKIETRELQGQLKVFSALMSLLTLLDLKLTGELRDAVKKLDAPAPVISTSTAPAPEPEVKYLN